MKALLKVRIYKDDKKDWRWSLKRDHSKKIVGASTEGYRRKVDMLKNFELVTGITGFDFDYQESGEAEWKVQR